MTSKELAEQLGLSQAAVSLALNNKPGVSEKTRARVKEAALKAGMDLSSMNSTRSSGDIRLVYYRKHGAVLQDTSFFASLTKGVEERCQSDGYRISSVNLYTKADLKQRLSEYAYTGVAGVILLGTEMQEEDFQAASAADLPLVLLDNHFQSDRIDSIQINNMDGAYTAADYLIRKKRKHPGNVIKLKNDIGRDSNERSS
jgi:LacI family transcriptional regulator